MWPFADSYVISIPHSFLLYDFYVFLWLGCALDFIMFKFIASDFFKGVRMFATPIYLH